MVIELLRTPFRRKSKVADGYISGNESTKSGSFSPKTKSPISVRCSSVPRSFGSDVKAIGSKIEQVGPVWPFWLSKWIKILLADNIFKQIIDCYISKGKVMFPYKWCDHKITKMTMNITLKTFLKLPIKIYMKNLNYKNKVYVFKYTSLFIKLMKI